MENGIHELTAGYALDALEPDERLAYEAHLRGCEPCREELAAFASVTEALAVGASGPTPRAELRSRILDEARAEPQVVVAFEPRGRRLMPVLAAAAAVAAVVALALGLWATQISGDLADTRSALASERALASILAHPEARNVALAAGSGRLVVDPEGRAVLVLEGLGAAPAGKTYEVWVVDGDVPLPAGLFPGRPDAELVGVEGIVEEGDVVAVTVEDAGGANAPSTRPIVASDPV